MATVKLKLLYKLREIPVEVTPHATFGDLKAFAAKATDMPPEGIRLMYRGRVKRDSDLLLSMGVKNGSKISILEDEGHRKRRTQQMAAEEAQLQDLSGRDEVRRQIAAIHDHVTQLEAEAAAVQAKVSAGAKGASSNGGGGLERAAAAAAAARLVELLTQHLLRLDGMQVSAEARLERKAEIVRIDRLCSQLEALRGAGPAPGGA